MTVIAYDHKAKTISVDSLVTQSDIRSGRVTKFIHLPTGGMAFGAGAWASVKRIFAALMAAETPDYDDFAEVTIIVVDEKGKVWEMDGSPQREPITKSWAWGSGWRLALGALKAGASSDEAAKIAAELDTSCGGPVHTFSTKGS